MHTQNSLEYPDLHMVKGNTDEGFTIFFVLKGWLNGMDINGQAERAGDNMGILEDGWYYLLDDEEVDGYGPYDSDREAIHAARDRLSQAALLKAWHKFQAEASELGFGDIDIKEFLESTVPVFQKFD